MAQPSARPSDPAHSTPVARSRRMICARPKTLRSCPATLATTKMSTFLQFAYHSVSSLPCSKYTTPHSVSHRQYKNVVDQWLVAYPICPATKPTVNCKCPCGCIKPPHIGQGGVQFVGIGMGQQCRYNGMIGLFVRSQRVGMLRILYIETKASIL